MPPPIPKERPTPKEIGFLGSIKSLVPYQVISKNSKL